MSEKAILRVVVCGSVDDGKSTLIGRLLSDTNSIPDDLREYARRTRRTGSLIPSGEIDYSLITDGLESEQEQGITIDVAYRQIHLDQNRRIILADSPGHEQYTRNMAVAASTADACILLTDASRKITDQTYRHLVICSVMKVSKIFVVVNKLDLLSNPFEKYEEYKKAVLQFSRSIDIPELNFIPISSLKGTNLIENENIFDWYTGPSLIQSLQGLEIYQPASNNLSIQIQNVLREDQYRGYTGTIISGQMSVGDSIKVAGSHYPSIVSSLVGSNDTNGVARAGEAVTFSLNKEIDISRGQFVIRSDDDKEVGRTFRATIVWLTSSPLNSQDSIILIGGSLTTPAAIKKIVSKVDLETGSQIVSTILNTHDIGAVEIEATIPFVLDTYQQNKRLGSFLLVNRYTKETIGAGMITDKLNNIESTYLNSFGVGRNERAAITGQKGAVFWLTGRPASGKTTIANAAEGELNSKGLLTYILDGDNLRFGINRDLGFSREDRSENVRRVAEIAWLLADAGIMVFVCLVSPFRSDRELVRQRFSSIPFYEVFIDTPLEICIQRDPKKLYQRASEGSIPNFTGISQEYERPISPSLILSGEKDLHESLESFYDFCRVNSLLI